MRQVLLNKYAIAGRRVTLEFSDNASPGFVKTLLDREFRDIGVTEGVPDPHGEGPQEEGRFKQMSLDFSAEAIANIKPGVYQLKFDTQGFASRTVEHLVLEVNQTVRQDVDLQIGELLL